MTNSPPMVACSSLEFLEALVGAPPQVSGYLALTQRDIDAFAELSGDRQWIHVDAERAARESPVGTTIAHGFLTISLMTRMFAECYSFPNRKLGLNYGFDRLRFVSPVPAGARIRGRFSLAAAERGGPDTVRCSWEALVEIEGRDKPAIAATWLSLITY